VPDNFTPVGVGTTAGREVRSQLSSCPRPILLCAKIALKMTAGVVPVPDNLPSHVDVGTTAGRENGYIPARDFEFPCPAKPPSVPRRDHGGQGD
jgi:hypothetical protein